MSTNRVLIEKLNFEKVRSQVLHQKYCSLLAKCGSGGGGDDVQLIININGSERVNIPVDTSQDLTVDLVV